jgi:hypothetical protein
LHSIRSAVSHTCNEPRPMCITCADCARIQYQRACTQPPCNDQARDQSCTSCHEVPNTENRPTSGSAFTLGSDTQRGPL